jgi:hypothetical protein
MTISITAVILVAFFIMLAVLGHGQWHGGEVAVAKFFVSLFTGATVTG